MTVECPACGKQHKASDRAAGKRVQCKECGYRFIIPVPTPPEVHAEQLAAIETKIKSKHFNLVMAVCAALSGGVGLAVGLNIHPPDQHEYEKGVEAGYRNGLSDGAQAATRIAAQECFEKMAEQENECTARITSAEKLLRFEAKRDTDELKAQFDASLKLARAASLRLGIQRGTDQERAAAQLRIEDLRAQWEDRLAKETQKAYEKGLEEDGYKKGYDDGRARALIELRNDIEAECVEKIAAAESVATQNADQQAYERGRKAGRIEGRSQGLAEGYKQGKADGYRIGYNKGYQDGRAFAGKGP